METNPAPRRDYPWLGDFDPRKSNCSETKIGATSAAGCFPSGVSPCGAFDLAGNVWEWSRDDTDAHGVRVLRGGSFDLDSSFVRCAVRNWGHPGLHNHYIGFHVVASPFSEL